MSHPHCDDVFSRLSEYLDRELPETTCQELEQHIAGCAPCVQFVESLKKSINMTRNVQADAEPGPLSAEAKDELRRAFDQIRRKHGR